MWLLAAEAPTPDPTSSGTWLFGVAAILAALVPLLLPLIRGRQKEQTTPSPPSPNGTEEAGYTRRVGERLAVVESRLTGLDQDHDELAETVDTIDRRNTRVEIGQEQITRFLDREFPRWR